MDAADLSLGNGSAPTEPVPESILHSTDFSAGTSTRPVLRDGPANVRAERIQEAGDQMLNPVRFES